MIEKEIKKLQALGAVNEDNEEEIRAALQKVGSESFWLGVEDGRHEAAETNSFTAYGKREDYITEEIR